MTMRQCLASPRIALVTASMLAVLAALATRAGETRPPEPIARAPAAPMSVLRPGVLLIAARGLTDPNFRRSVVLLLDYDPGGALGIVINRPAAYAMADVLGEHPPPGEPGWVERVRVHLGGPVEPRRVFILLEADESPPDAREVTSRLYASGSLRALQWAGTALAPDSVRIYAGYAGWGPAQLDRELRSGGWHVLPATPEHVFTPPADLWEGLIRQAAGTWVDHERSNEAYDLVRAPSWRERGARAPPPGTTLGTVRAGPPEPAGRGA